MVRSMTGYGRMQQILGGRDITVEIKSVNHRFFEFSCRVPRAYGYLEEKLKSAVQARVARGKVEVGVAILPLDGSSSEVQINMELAQAYLSALSALSERTGLANDMTVSSFCRFSDIFTVRKAPEDEEQIWQDVQTVLSGALDAFVAMREAEGERLHRDMEGRLDAIGRLVGQVEARSPKTVEEYRERLYAKLREVLESAQIDEQRLLTEAAIFAEKIAVDEETVRLRSHLRQFATILEGEGPVGRKLDFLIQEFNREANTIGSKAQDLEIASIVVEMKSEIEKIREQIQNIE